MTLQAYCALDFVPFELRASFAAWLGSTANSRLPLTAWRRLWGEFVRVVSEVSR